MGVVFTVGTAAAAVVLDAFVVAGVAVGFGAAYIAHNQHSIHDETPQRTGALFVTGAASTCPDGAEGANDASGVLVGFTTGDDDGSDDDGGWVGNGDGSGAGSDCDGEEGTGSGDDEDEDEGTGAEEEDAGAEEEEVGKGAGVEGSGSGADVDVGSAGGE